MQLQKIWQSRKVLSLNSKTLMYNKIELSFVFLSDCLNFKSKQFGKVLMELQGGIIPYITLLRYYAKTLVYNFKAYFVFLSDLL